MSNLDSIWPTLPFSFTLSTPAKSTIDRFYTLVDTHSETAFDAWTHLFFEDGMIEIGKKKRTGWDELYAERARSWDLIASRQHHVLRVYIHCAERDRIDLVVLGRVDIEVRGNGVRFSQEFAQRFVVEMDGQDEGGTRRDEGTADEQRGGGERWRIRKFQAWIDSAILERAIAGEQP